LARYGVHAEFLNARIGIKAERVAKPAPAVLAFEFFVGDPAWMGVQRNLARLIDGDLRVAASCCPV
jgi:hypothetical protein